MKSVPESDLISEIMDRYELPKERVAALVRQGRR